MPSERVQRQIDALLDEAEAAIRAEDWETVRQRVRSVLALDPENIDARTYAAAADRSAALLPSAPEALAPQPIASAQPTSFANGRYTVKRFLGEGGKKKVYLAHDALLDRDVAFALIKTEGLDDASRTRITREAQAMGRLGDHPNIVTVYDIGEEDGAPYMVLPVLAGGDVEGVIEKAPEQRMPLERALKIAIETCRGLEFAHGRGIVHRDLKPGNVWLSEDGTAKIGDFGLAVATDRSRLTQAGMMVGTVSYMPPEQAMGGEIGPRSDLYSLGAMLYEMVCGRPPFVGDESVAIIGQHLNTPPVAPTWHRPDCPPGLETLILRLLEKDPSKRPATATEVREALESATSSRSQVSIDPSVATESPSTGGNPVYRRTFVGREHEAKQLQTAFDAALSGQAGLVMVVGEPGIGKTALCEQLATYVALRGGRALVGHCYEEGSLSLPYLAFVEAMRSYVLARDPDGLRSDLGTSAADVARIVSEVRDRVSGLELRPPSDPEDDHWRLLQAVTSFLRQASTVQPLLIVLEDLHWADRGTLELLLHVVRNLASARLLIVGTYRDVEVDRSHPLSGTLGDLRRLPSFSRVPLRGLTVDEVQRMMSNIRGQEAPWSRAEAVHRQTEGNPLFVQEVLRYIAEEALIERQDARNVSTDRADSDVGIPEGLRDVIGKRLSRLSAECNRLLAVAAVIGRDFDLATLRAVANVSEDELLSAIEEAVRVGVLEERSQLGRVLYRFAHAFFRLTLYEEMIAPRRLRLHQEVARALEAQYGSRREEHAAELAEHFAQSTDRADLAKAVEYGELAAGRAMAVYAFAEAASHLKRCLAVQEVLDPDDKARLVDLLIQIGSAQNQDGDRDAGRKNMLAAAQLARTAGLRDAMVQACDTLSEAVGGIVFDEIEVADLRREALAFLEGRMTSAHSRILTALAHSLAKDGARTEEAMQALRESADIGRRIGDPSATYESLLNQDASMHPLSEYTEEDKTVRAEMAQLLDQMGSAALNQRWFTARAGDALEMGDLEGFNAARAGLERLAQVQPTYRHTLTVLRLAGYQMAFQGDFDGHERFVEETNISEFRQGQAWIDQNILLNCERILYGRPDGAQAALEAAQRRLEANPELVINRLFLSLAYMALGREDDARKEFDIAAQAGFDRLGVHVRTRGLGIAAYICAYLHDVERAGDIYELLLPFDGRNLTSSGAVPRVIGAASFYLALLDETLGQWSRARQHLESAAQMHEKMGARPLNALARLELAEVLLGHYPDERDAAIEHLDFAIAELRDMKMQPALERALRHRGLLKA